MMNEIIFGTIHSYEDLNLILSQVNFAPAFPKTVFVDIPGGDGSVDLTEALGEVKFQDRTHEFLFTVLPQDDFEEKKRAVSNLLNGAKMKITYTKDPNYYWLGRCSVDQYASDKNIHQIVVKAVVAPYKYKQAVTEIIISAGTSLQRVLTNGRKSVVPKITTTADATIVFKGNTYKLTAGTNKLLNIMFTHGENIITVTSTQPVKFSYQEGDL